MPALLAGAVALGIDKLKTSRENKKAARLVTSTNISDAANAPSASHANRSTSMSSSRSTTTTTPAAATAHLSPTEYQARMLHKYNTGRFNTHPLHRPSLGDGLDAEEGVDEELPRYSTDVNGAPPVYKESVGDDEVERRSREVRDRAEAVSFAEAKVKSLGGRVGATSGWGWA